MASVNIQNSSEMKLITELERAIARDPNSAHKYKAMLEQIYQRNMMYNPPDHTPHLDILDNIFDKAFEENHQIISQEDLFDAKKILLLRIKGWKNRLRVNSDAIPFEYFHVHYGEGTDKLHIVIIHKNQVVTLEDDQEMFPSDRLVTQLRLLLESSKEGAR